MKFVNLTPRDVSVLDDEGNLIMKLPQSGSVAVCATKMNVVDRINFGQHDQVDVVSYEYDSVNNLPAPQEGTLLVVSYAVLQALKNSRADVIAPDTSPVSVVRAAGSQKVIGVKRFRKL